MALGWRHATCMTAVALGPPRSVKTQTVSPKGFTSWLSSVASSPGAPTHTFQKPNLLHRFAGFFLRLRHNHLDEQNAHPRDRSGRVYPPTPPLKIRSFPQKVCRKFDAGNATSSVACERRLPKCYWRIARHLLQGTTHPFPSLSFRPDPERSEGVVEESAVVLRLVYIGTTSGCPHRLDQATLSRNVLLNAV